MIEHLYYGAWEDVEIEDAEGRAREQRSRGAVVCNVEDRWIRAIDLQRDRRRPPTREQATQIYHAVRRRVNVPSPSSVGECREGYYAEGERLGEPYTVRCVYTRLLPYSKLGQPPERWVTWVGVSENAPREGQCLRTDWLKMPLR